MNKSLLDIDLRVLLARYGRRQVMQGLAGILETTVEQIEAELREIEQKCEKKFRQRIQAPEEVLDEVTKTAPAAREVLRKLMLLYENRFFLPELRSVHAFLDRRGTSNSYRSRKEALLPVMRVLATLNHEELQSLVESANTREGGSSDYSLLANEIMASPRKPIGN